ncbi:MAG: YbaK/EbsC family protein [Cellulomonadaceae bacterium]|nr:YbaK/EbsC family protein [Cellulomonadaceae bacterium]
MRETSEQGPGEAAEVDAPGVQGEAATAGEQRAVAALEASGLRYRLVRHGPVRSLAEAAAARHLSPDQIVKTLVVRRGEDDYLLVLVPGGRTISWPLLRELLGVSRLSMPDATVAREVTGYERGTITPFGSSTPWPVIADARVPGRAVSIGAGAHGVAATLDGSAMVLALGATVADVTEAEPV